MHLALVELLLQGWRLHPHHGGAGFGVFLGHYHCLWQRSVRLQLGADFQRESARGASVCISGHYLGARARSVRLLRCRCCDWLTVTAPEQATWAQVLCGYVRRVTWSWCAPRLDRHVTFDLKLGRAAHFRFSRRAHPRRSEVGQQASTAVLRVQVHP